MKFVVALLAAVMVTIAWQTSAQSKSFSPNLAAPYARTPLVLLH